MKGLTSPFLDLAPRQLAMFGGYVALLAALLVSSAVSLANAYGALSIRSESEGRLAAFGRHAPGSAGPKPAAPAAAWLTDRTAGLAAATLQARVEAAARVQRAKTLSSRVELGEAAGNGVLAYTGEFELDATALQPLIYDLEAGSPFLIVQDLAIHSEPGADSGSRLRLALTLGAAWRPAP